MLSPIGPDPLTVIFFIITCLKFGGNIKAVPGEVNAYMNTSTIALDRLRRVEAVRKTAWCPRAVGTRIDKQLQKIRRVLHDAHRDVRGVYAANDAQLDPHFGAAERLAWIFKYKNVAEANKKMLEICLTELHQIQNELDQASASMPRVEIEYFKATEAEKWNVLSKRATY